MVRGYQRGWNRPPTHQILDLAIVGKGLQIQAETKSGQVVVRRGRRETGVHEGGVASHGGDLDAAVTFTGSHITRESLM